MQEAFSANQREDFHLIGTLADSIQVDAQWERAVEGVFGSSLQSILVPTPDDAIRAAGWLKANQAGRATFLVTGFHGGSDETAVLTRIGTATTAASRQQYVPVGIDGPRVERTISGAPAIPDQRPQGNGRSDAAPAKGKNANLAQETRRN